MLANSVDLQLKKRCVVRVSFKILRYQMQGLNTRVGSQTQRTIAVIETRTGCTYFRLPYILGQPTLLELNVQLSVHFQAEKCVRSPYNLAYNLTYNLAYILEPTVWFQCCLQSCQNIRYTKCAYNLVAPRGKAYNLVPKHAYNLVKHILFNHLCIQSQKPQL